MSTEIATYTIGDKTYIQKPMVLAQIKQVINLLQGVQIPTTFDPASIIFVLGDKLSTALAILLLEKGTSLRDKDIEGLASDLEFDVDPETAVKILEDFFCSNQIASILDRVNQMVEKMKITMEQTGLTTSSAS